MSQGIICRFLAFLLLWRFNLYFILVLEKLMLLVSDAIVYQARVPGKFSPRALQKKGDCYAIFLISPLLLRL